MKSKFKSLIHFTLFISLLASIQIAQANTSNAISIEGTVLLNGVRMNLDDEVKQGDIIKTGPNSGVVLLMADKTVINLTEKTDFKVTEYKYSGGKSGSGKSKFSLLKGAFRYVSGLIAKNNHDDVSFTAGTATIGIRGSYTSMVFDGNTGLSVDSAIGTAVISFTDGTSFTVSPGTSGSINISTGTGTTASSALIAALADPTNADVSSLSDNEALVLAAAIAANAEALGLSDQQVAQSIANINDQKPNVSAKINAVTTSIKPAISSYLAAENEAIGLGNTSSRITTQPRVSGSPLLIDPVTGGLASPN